jgi:hypothetical protein
MSNPLEHRPKCERDQKLPALQFYPGDWRKDVGVQSLSFHDRGVWFEMLMLMHQSERRGVLILNGQPMSDEMIARAIGSDASSFSETLANLISTGVASREEETGALMNRRMVRDESLRKVRARAGALGGNPILLKQNRTTQVMQTATPSCSFSVSSSTSNSTTANSDDLPSWIPQDAWGAYLEMRESIGAPLTARAAGIAIKRLKQLKEEGNDPVVVLEQSVFRSWRGLFPVRAEAPAKEYTPAQVGLPVSPEIVEARRISEAYEEYHAYWIWLSMSEEFRKVNPRKPPEGWHDNWRPHTM